MVAETTLPGLAAGGHYRAPDDEVLRLQRTKAIEEPGVLAGFSHVTGLPQLQGGLVVPQKGYAYAPLNRRMDNDRLYRAIRESPEFSDVWPWGSGPQNKKKDSNTSTRRRRGPTSIATSCCARFQETRRNGKLVSHMRQE